MNHRSRLWTADQASAVLRDWIPYVDIRISPADELSLCLPPGSPTDITAQARQMPVAGVTEVVVKLGPDGATSYTHPEPHPANQRPCHPHHAADGSLHQPAVPVQAVDPVGAGDAFAAGYLSALLDGEGVAGHLEGGVTTGAFAVTSPGDGEGAPTRAELHLLGAPPGTVVR
ncbi:PfkB family carbohydrate kinase [Streptomyces rimosus]|uniref:PfkB family carbohydrate kinase n=1 Tax=Streptomyces rimosus TaxID=1927 RepID=UPI0037CE5E01